ncbi:MAG: hypothetical protein JW804_04895 [Sedimentisphaerales bacterium]|nr:hypothetical protein [Sedimentisphaerales bacterium]
MIFVTVGSQFPFDRLIKAVDFLKDEGLIVQEIFAQTGNSQYKPRNFEYVNFLEKHLFDKYVHDASAVISHAGIGIISKSLEYEKTLLAMPRLAKNAEVVNDHQLAIANKFERLGHILVAYSQEELPDKIRELDTFVPVKRQKQPEKLAEKIQLFLDDIYAQKKL